MPGPAPKPRVQRQLEGNPSGRPIPDEPKPDLTADSGAPAWLTGDARAIWDSLAPELHRLRLLTKLDVEALAGACWWWDVFMTNARRLKSRRFVIKKQGGATKRPEVLLAQQGFEMAMGVFVKFGVTPGERMRLAAPSARAAHEGIIPPKDAHTLLAARRAARAEHSSAA